MKSPKGRVLLLDDDVLVAMNNKDILEGLGYKCRLAHKIQDAFHFLKHNEYCLILCDHDLPDGKGLSLIKKMPANNSKTPVLYLSAAPPSVLKEANNYEQIKQILSKPLSANQLISAIEELKLPDTYKQQRLIGSEERQMLLEVHKNDEPDNK